MRGNVSKRSKSWCASLILIIGLAGCSRSSSDGQQRSTSSGDLTDSAATTSAPGDIVPGDQASGHMLSETERSYLWDIEHLGFVMEQTVFARLKSSLNDGTLSAWHSFLAEDCVTQLPAVDSAEQLMLTGSARVARIPTGSATSTNHKNSFLNWLAEQRGRMSKCSSSVGLVRLGPAEDRDFAGPWYSVWRVRMAGEQSAADANPAGPLEFVFDLEVDLAKLDEQISAQDHWVTRIGVQNYRSFAAEKNLLEETTATSGLVHPERYDNWQQSVFVPNTGGVYVTDYDNDGHLDVFIDDHRLAGRLYRGHGDGTFEDVTEQAGLPVDMEAPLWTLSCWGDFDGDGDDDLITQDRIYENLGNGKFVDRTSQCNLPLTPASGYAVADYNNDGRLDLYVCHTSAYRVGQQQKSRVSWIDDGLGVDNVLYENLGNWEFRDVTEMTGTGGNGSSCFAAVWLHANSDLRPDLFAINEFGRNSLLLSREDGTFQESDVDPIFGGFSMGVAAGDFDNDGWSDLYVANMYSKAGNRILANVHLGEYPVDVFRKIEEGTRGSKLYRSPGSDDSRGWQTVPAEDMHADVGWSYGATFTDLDSDGWLDLYATAGFKSVKRGEPDG